MAGGSWLVRVYSGLFRHGLARLGEARQVWIGSRRYGGAVQGPDRFGKARPGKAGWVRRGVLSSGCFGWDLARIGRFGLRWRGNAVRVGAS